MSAHANGSSMHGKRCINADSMLICLLTRSIQDCSEPVPRPDSQTDTAPHVVKFTALWTAHPSHSTCTPAPIEHSTKTPPLIFSPLESDSISVAFYIPELLRLVLTLHNSMPHRTTMHRYKWSSRRAVPRTQQVTLTLMAAPDYSSSHH